PVPGITVDMGPQAVVVHHQEAIWPEQAGVGKGRGSPNVVTSPASRCYKTGPVYLSTGPSVRPCGPGRDERQLGRAAKDPAFCRCAPVFYIGIRDKQSLAECVGAVSGRTPTRSLFPVPVRLMVPVQFSVEEKPTVVVLHVPDAVGFRALYVRCGGPYGRSVYDTLSAIGKTEWVKVEPCFKRSVTIRQLGDSSIPPACVVFVKVLVVINCGASRSSTSGRSNRIITCDCASPGSF